MKPGEWLIEWLSVTTLAGVCSLNLGMLTHLVATGGEWGRISDKVVIALFSGVMAARKASTLPRVPSGGPRRPQ